MSSRGAARVGGRGVCGYLDGKEIKKGRRARVGFYHLIKNRTRGHKVWRIGSVLMIALRSAVLAASLGLANARPEVRAQARMPREAHRLRRRRARERERSRVNESFSVVSLRIA